MPTGVFYAYVWNSESERKHLKTKLSDFAKLGLVIAVSKPTYQGLKSQNVQ
jgi:hypothetical protein